MNLRGTFAKSFEMIKHARHFRRTLPMVLVFEAILECVLIEMHGQETTKTYPKRKTRELLARAFPFHDAEFSD